MYRCTYCSIFEAETLDQVEDHVTYLQGIGDREHSDLSRSIDDEDRGWTEFEADYDEED